MAFRIPDELLVWVDARAGISGLNRSQTIISVLRGEMGDGDEKADRGVRAASGKKKSVGEKDLVTAQKGGAIKSKGTNIGKAGSGASAVVIESRSVLRRVAAQKGKAVPEWFPVSMCPHGYQNSSKCEESGGGCER